MKADSTVPTYRCAVGQQYRVGYYRREDGLGTIWLVDDNGNYFGTTDKKQLAKYFAAESITNESNLFGDHRPRLPVRRQPKSKDFLPPLTLLQLEHPILLRHLQLIADQVGQFFRIGYYSPNDGLNTIWIVNEDGEYVGTIARDRLKKYFRVLSISNEVDYCGVRAIDPLPKQQRLEAERMRRIVRSKARRRGKKP
jgi:hypothetical protein